MVFEYNVIILIFMYTRIFRQLLFYVKYIKKNAYHTFEFNKDNRMEDRKIVLNHFMSTI